MQYSYDNGFDPPAPVAPIIIFRAFGTPETGRQIRCLIDSGSDEVWLPENELQNLGCLQVDQTLVEYADGGQSLRPLYYVGVRIEQHVDEALEVIAGGNGEHALIGRRVLNRFVCELNGPDSVVEIR